MNLREAHLKMKESYAGGTAALATAMGLTESAFNNRMYGLKGQQFTTEQSLAMQMLTGTTYFAEAIARQSSGVFVQKPEPEIGSMDLFEQLLKATGSMGKFTNATHSAIQDGVIDQEEAKELKLKINEFLSSFYGLWLHIEQIHKRGEDE